MNTISVALPRSDVRNVSVPDEGCNLGESVTHLIAEIVEKANLDRGSVFGVDGEVDSVAVPGRAEGVRGSGQEGHGTMGMQSDLQIESGRPSP